MKKILTILYIVTIANISIAQIYNIRITKKDGTSSIISSEQLEKFEFIPVNVDPQYADLMDIVFNEDGTAKDMSPYHHQVITNAGTGLTTYYNEMLKKHVANFTHALGSTVTNGYYRIKYTPAGDFISKIADGCTIETIIRLGVSDEPTKEVKWFSSHQTGGIGFLLPKHNDATPGTKSMTFLPNVSTTGKSTWRWTYSNIIPEVGKFYHVVGVWNKEEGKSHIYINGQLCGTADAPGDYVPVASGAESFIIGGDPDTKDVNCTTSWNGDVASVRIHDKPMTFDEVANLWKETAFDTNVTYTGITDLQFLPVCEVGVGYKLTFYGKGFAEGDKLTFTSEDSKTILTLPTQIGEDSATITIPEEMVSSNYKVMLNRLDSQTILGSVKITVSSAPQLPQKVKVIAHRGAHTDGASENSIAALKKAMSAGYDGVELDVWLTKDKKLVVHHDGKYNGITFQTANYSDIKDIKLSNGENLPTLESFISTFKENANGITKLIIEIKSHSTEDLTIEATEQTMNAVKEAGITDMVEYIAFSYPACQYICQKDPSAIAGYLNGDKSPSVVNQAKIKSIDYKMTVYDANPEWIRQAKDLGMIVNVWTVNSSGEMLKFIGSGADYITTDDPSALSMISKKIFVAP